MLHLFINAGTARPLVCAVTTIKPMAAMELHRHWLEGPPKLARLGWASDYLMRAFTKAPQISSPSATTTRSSLFETRSLCHWTSHRSRSRPLSARPTRRFSAAGSACSCWFTDSLPLSGDSFLWEPSIKEQISRRCCKCHWQTLHVTDKHGECVSCLEAWACNSAY